MNDTAYETQSLEQEAAAVDALHTEAPPVPPKPPRPSPHPLVIIGFAIILGINGVLAYYVLQPSQPTGITSYSQCVEANGSTIDDIHTASCVTTNGQVFVNPAAQAIAEPNIPDKVLPSVPPIAKTRAKDGCVIGGCSNQLCLNPGDDVSSTCEYKESYACLRFATCGKLTSGSCGWTYDSIYESCMESYN